MKYYEIHKYLCSSLKSEYLSQLLSWKFYNIQVSQTHQFIFPHFTYVETRTSQLQNPPPALGI